jgi:hypothetical protein
VWSRRWACLAVAHAKLVEPGGPDLGRDDTVREAVVGEVVAELRWGGTSTAHGQPHGALDVGRSRAACTSQQPDLLRCRAVRTNGGLAHRLHNIVLYDERL